MTRFPVRKSKQIITAALALLSIQFSSSVLAAQPEDPLNFVFGTDVRYEDNLFRVEEGTPLGDASKHDIATTYSAGIKLDKLYSLQRFQVDATVTENRYQENDFLNWKGFNYRAAWLWSITPRVKGTLLATRNETLNNFGDFRRIDPNTGSTRNLSSIQTNERREFTADVLLWGGWHVVGGVAEVESRNSQSFNEVGDFTQDSAEFGGRYVFPSGSEITLVHREATGDYNRGVDITRQLDTGYDQSETEAKLDWRITGKSRITARVGYIDREHDNFSLRDYNGMTGLLTWLWTPTGKLLVNTAISRNLYSFQESNAIGGGLFFANGYDYSYYVADTFTVSPLWAITDKTSLRFRYDWSDRDYRGELNPVGPTRRDIVQSMTLTAEWEAMRTLVISAVARREDRNSDREGFDYEADSIGISAELIF
ncbi:MAG TPA: XrtB/PEP-CTERM-associated polysaccharide biosynthesis outer membrane protein EpsL [Methylophilaceae bacterium]|nr:XrtB/PEP-CTERM-associated polysaccharide biosynthesis outer membrane protein EpsL [Methylophilaceae bacterium]